MIELKNISKWYKTGTGRHVVLDDISLTFPGRESIGIVGRNGAGKSTLLRIIGGAEMPSEGRVIRRGRISWPIGFGGGFNGSLSGAENCRFVARIYGHDPDYVVDSTRDFAEIGEYFHEPVRTYSSGMRARLAFGLSMAIDFEMYLVDEVTAVGDKLFREKCRAAFAALRRTSGLIMVSHSYETLAEYCNTCVVLDRGRISMYGSVEEASKAYEKGLVAA